MFRGWSPNRNPGGTLRESGLKFQRTHGQTFGTPGIKSGEGKVLRVHALDMETNLSKSRVEADVLLKTGGTLRNCYVAVPVGYGGKYDASYLCPFQPETPLDDVAVSSMTYDEIEGEKVIVLYLDDSGFRPVIIASLDFTAKTWPMKPIGPKVATGLISRLSSKGITTFTSADGVFNIIAEDTPETGGIPDAEGVAETSNAIRFAKGNSAFYIDKEKDVFIQHESGFMIQVCKNPNPAMTHDCTFVIKDGHILPGAPPGFSLNIDTLLKTMMLSVGAFNIIAMPDLGMWLIGILGPSGFDGIVYMSGVGFLSASTALIASAGIFWSASTITLLGTAALSMAAPALWAIPGTTGTPPNNPVTSSLTTFISP